VADGADKVGENHGPVCAAGICLNNENKRNMYTYFV
jgi:hypothetical protein